MGDGLRTFARTLKEVSEVAFREVAFRKLRFRERLATDEVACGCRGHRPSLAGGVFVNVLNGNWSCLDYGWVGYAGCGEERLYLLGGECDR